MKITTNIKQTSDNHHYYVWCMTTWLRMFSSFDINKNYSETSVEEDCWENKGECLSVFFSCITTVSILNVASWMEWSYWLTFETSLSWKASSSTVHHIEMLPLEYTKKYSQMVDPSSLPGLQEVAWDKDP